MARVVSEVASENPTLTPSSVVDDTTELEREVFLSDSHEDSQT
eukprot:CAMPEP_0113687900 /NCGR_PEP_ID=MMETSP0038_2-20120614/16207_1 /TAXON_ID=2898 /ORGANISM="Cryptomonas paramecium" /LENGTH=42 /DNA_ID=CAMNT_0000608595 /DNA_START=311 /DNA_END=439 /DNA_ORIENTATION=- /assembly_acc=CAM_ASM_000170